MTDQSYDVVVVGAGLGGLLAAATAASAGKSVLVLERLPYVGGRFTTVDQDGCQITTGALHLVPHGTGGVLARFMASIGQPLQAVPRDAIASVFTGGRHVVWRTPLDVLQTFGPRGKRDVLRMFAELAVRPRQAAMTFGDWVDARTGDQTLRRLFERFSHFALSIRPDQVSYEEMRAVFWNVARHGLPCAPAGGCRGLVERLTDQIRAHGGQVCTSTEVTEIVCDGHAKRACGVRFRDRRSGREEVVHARAVVSDAGPDVTARLLNHVGELALPTRQAVAAGLKLHVVSDRSLIPHQGIMFCLDTERISGIVEVSNSVPAVAPPGMHMLDTFQVLMTDDFARERRLAVDDLRSVFGAAFDRHCRVVRASSFRAAWPVNRAIQGRDHRNQEPMPGLIMVGDAYKQPGYIMVEGVASSVREVAARLRG